MVCQPGEVFLRGGGASGDSRAGQDIDFGTVAIATVFIHLFSTIVTESFSPAIIQNKQLTERDLRAINSFTYLMAFALTGLYLLAVPFIVAYYETEVLSTILTVFAVSIFFSIISIVPNALLMKAKRFRFIAMMSLGIHLALAVMSIAAVTQGMGIYALLVEPVGHGVLLFAVSYAAYPVKWSWPRRPGVLREVLPVDDAAVGERFERDIPRVASAVERVPK